MFDPTKYKTQFATPTDTSKDVITLKKEISSIVENTDFSASPITQYFHAVEYQNLTIDLKEALQINIYPLLMQEILYRLKTNQNMNWSIFGAPGTGKSLGGLSMYEHISKITGVPLKTRNMYTDGGDLYMRLLTLYETKLGKKDLVKNDVIFSDENVNDRTGLGSVHMMTQNAEMEVRIRIAQIHFIWVSTVLYPHQSTLIMETYDTERDPADLAMIRRIRMLCYDHNNVLKGCMILPAPDQLVIKAYLKHIKWKSLQSFFSGETDSRAKMYRTIADECMSEQAFRVLANKEQRMQYIEENYGHMNLSIGQQIRILGLCKPTKEHKSLESLLGTTQKENKQEEDDDNG